jgi:hypothetical protein
MIGIVVVAALPACAVALALVTMTITYRFTKSVAITERSSIRPFAQRYSIATF